MEHEELDAKVVNGFEDGKNDSESETNAHDPMIPNGEVHKKGSSAAQLQKRLERRIEKAWNNKLIDQQPKKSTMMPIARLPVPNKVTTTSSSLVTWDSDSENEFEYSPSASNENSEINQQLLREHNGDLSFDEEDLDLIPPKPLSQRCVCCATVRTCSIQ